MRVGVIGSRDIKGSDKSAKQIVFQTLEKNIPENCTEIVSGGAIGVDTFAAEFAKKKRLNLKVFLPKYDKFGKEAPLLRNIEIVEYSQYVLAFWDGKSRGTAYTVSTCVEKGIPVKVIRIDCPEASEK